MNEDFFDAQTKSSFTKAKIVAEYFPSYAKILLKNHQDSVRYLDLFAGTGVYGDGQDSTPMLIGASCQSDPVLSCKVHILLNDIQYIETLKLHFQSRFPQGTFKYEPRFGGLDAGGEKIKEYLERKPKRRNPNPTLMFYDPFGYETIETTSLANWLKSWGNELFLFVNIKRLNQAVTSAKHEVTMRKIFPTLFDKIKNERAQLSSPKLRTAYLASMIEHEFKIAMKHELFHCRFEFREEDSTGTSHYIIHFTKDKRGFDLVKQVYSEFDNIGSFLGEDGCYTFDKKKIGYEKLSTIPFGDPNIEDLSTMICKDFRGATISAWSLYDSHQVKNNYNIKHYRLALRKLVESNKIQAKFTDNIDHKFSVTLTPQCILTFPKN